MKRYGLCVAVAVLLGCGGFCDVARGQDASKPAYLNTELPAEQRAADLVHRMTLEEKTTQLVNQARAISRLNIPAYDWWSESLHGVAAKGMTSFPEPIGLAATFDARRFMKWPSRSEPKARIHHVQSVRAGHSDIFEGLDFWAPNINIFRDPRWGRGQETYGEDPFLTGRMGTAFVTGMQGDDPRYYRVISTPKHFAVHSGPESTRHKANVRREQARRTGYVFARISRGYHARQSGIDHVRLQQHQWRTGVREHISARGSAARQMEIQGYVVSDCGAVIDIFNGHHFKPTQAEASAISLRRGMDNECADFSRKSMMTTTTSRTSTP